MLTDRQTDKNRQMYRQNYTNFERNLAMRVMYLPVKFEFDWTQRFRVRVRKQKCWRTKNRQMYRRNYTNFERNLAMMVIYLPVKFEFDWTKNFLVRVQKRKCWRTDKWTKNGPNYTNFKRNLAVMVIYPPLMFEFDWTNRFRVRVQNGNFDGQTNGQKTDKRTELQQFRKKPSCDGDLSPCQIWIRLDKPFLS